MMLQDIPRFDLLGVPIAALNLPTAVEVLYRLAADRAGEGPAAYVCIRDVNGIVESQRDPELKRIHHEAALVTPDGMPLVWWGWFCGHSTTDRVYGPDLMTEVCRRSPALGVRHFLYGGDIGVAEGLVTALSARFPGLQVVGTWTPPFRALTPAERASVVQAINASRADIVWVGLSSPKQERFMAEIAGDLRCGVLIGVGAAFDFLSSRKPQAPRWIQRSGFEWLFRLATEPRRLWRRYLFNNTAFIYLLARRLLRERMNLAPR